MLASCAVLCVRIRACTPEGDPFSRKRSLALISRYSQPISHHTGLLYATKPTFILLLCLPAGQQVNATSCPGGATGPVAGKFCAVYPGTNQACLFEYATHKCRESRGPCETDAFCEYPCLLMLCSGARDAFAVGAGAWNFCHMCSCEPTLPLTPLVTVCLTCNLWLNGSQMSTACSVMFLGVARTALLS